MKTLLLASIVILFYTYFGYGVIMAFLSKLRKRTNRFSPKDYQLPTVTLLIPAYNEAQYIEQKLVNSLNLDYPTSKIKIAVVADGSADSTTAIVNKYPQVKLFYKKERKGKVAAVNRVMHHIDTDVTILTDANTTLNREAISMMVRHFSRQEVVAVSGEKKIRQKDVDDAASSGEGFYWRYESLLKRLDANVNTLVGAAGELIAFRTDAYESVPENMIIEDFYMTMRYCQKGYKVAYEPKAFASEAPSASVKEEMKRKIRICAGGFQAISKLAHLLNPFQYGFLTFQYVSHRVLRWTLAPISLITLFVSSAMLASTGLTYLFLTCAQALFYGIAIFGFYLKDKKIKSKLLHIPYYFSLMNYAAFLGFFRFMKGEQSVLWEKAMRRI